MFLTRQCAGCAGQSLARHAGLHEKIALAKHALSGSAPKRAYTIKQNTKIPTAQASWAGGWSVMQQQPAAATEAPQPRITRTYTISSISSRRSSDSSGSSRVVADASTPRQSSTASSQQPTPRFRLVRVTGDGSCMFRAIAQGAQIASRGLPMSVESEGQAALNLRKAVVEELRKRKSEIEPFITGIIENFPSWEAYLERMSDPDVWGGEPEMVMAVNIVRRPISVYRLVNGSAEPIVTYGEELLQQGVQPIYLLWSGAHYDLLVYEDGSSSSGSTSSRVQGSSSPFQRQGGGPGQSKM